MQAKQVFYHDSLAAFLRLLLSLLNLQMQANLICSLRLTDNSQTTALTNRLSRITLPITRRRYSLNLTDQLSTVSCMGVVMSRHLQLHLNK